MTIADRFVNPRPKFTSAINGTLPGGKLFFFDTETTTLKAIFEDQSEETEAANPAILDATGTVPDIFLNGTYRVRHTDKNDVQIWQLDGIGGDIAGGAFDDWSETISYETGDLVTGDDGCRYQSIVDDNLNNDPTGEGNPESWEKIGFTRFYNANVTYLLDDVVRASDGEDYQSLVADNLGNDPTTDNGLNWTLQTLTPVIRAAARTFAYRNF